jgi:mannan endo-1,4-beta-mannosidase
LKRRLLAVASVAAVLAAGLAAPPASAHGTGGFVQRIGTGLWLNGRPFKIAGSNNYYLEYKSNLMVDDVLNDARNAEFNVIRHWGFLDIGDPVTGEGSIHGPADGVYFQYWDKAAGKPAYNDGPTGLQKLDYVIWKAGQLGLKVVIPLTNNWGDFGGMDQYVRWRGGSFHDDFYTDAVIRGWYKDWISHVLNRVNPLTGLAYKNDPTIMTWELSNEARCKGSGTYPTSPACTTSTLTAWADELSKHIKSVDKHHLVSVGDEGFYCDDPASSDWPFNCGEGVDNSAFIRLPAIDVSSYHLYPDSWGKDPAWGTDWIQRHVKDAKRAGKVSMLGEFGLRDHTIRDPNYQKWLSAEIAAGGNGFLYWILSGIQDDGTLYPDYDGFTVYCPSPECTQMTNAGRISRGALPFFPPVADDDSAVTTFNTAVTIPAAANDIAYLVKVDPKTIDLDPAAAGRQASLTLASGTFAAKPDGTIVFTPADGFSGRVAASYTVLDQIHRKSNVAALNLVVKPDPTAAITLYSWETGTEGWGPPAWSPSSGTVAQDTQFATDGTHSLRVDAAVEDWFGLTLPTPLDLSTKSMITFDVATTTAGSNVAIAFKTGPEGTWCQTSNWTFLNPNSTKHAEVGLFTDMSSCGDGIKDVRDIYLRAAPGGVFIDNLRAV